MNALAEDQLGRLRELLAGSGVTFGMYVGKTPENTSDAPGKKIPDGASKLDYERELEKAKREKQTYAIYPAEERVSREEMRTKGKQPRILLTNVNQLELLLTRQRDVELFNGAKLEFLVFDEAHTFTGAMGAETACLIRRLRAFCGKGTTDTTCIATSATIVDAESGADAGSDFAARFFGVPPENLVMVQEEYEPDLWTEFRQVTTALPGNPAQHLKDVLNAVEGGDMAPGGYREPARNVRAVAVSDVHVLAQNMIHHAERRRLLVFADNRQDAAFQAGWMQDHARRFRLRSLMYDRIKSSAVSVGDLTAYLDDPPRCLSLQYLSSRSPASYSPHGLHSVALQRQDRV